MNTTVTPAALPSEHEAELARESRRNLVTIVNSHAETQQFDFKDEKGEAHTMRVGPI